MLEEAEKHKVDDGAKKNRIEANVESMGDMKTTATFSKPL
jgi:hypothetical protein